MVHLKNDRYLPMHSRHLVYKARHFCASIPASIRVVRVASKFIEFDVSVEKEKIDIVIEKLSPLGKLDNIRHVVEEEIEKEDGIKDGIFYYNNERFWEAHEAWEGAWKKCYGEEKELLQGIILVAVAFAHCQKNDEKIGIGMLGRALKKIGNYTGMYNNMDVDRIRKRITQMQNAREMTIFEI